MIEYGRAVLRTLRANGIFCTWLLWRAYYRSRYRLLLWGGLCFFGLTLNNALLVVDKLLCLR
ncbi:MAG TPA: DUF5985 family protein [Candidatus Binatia bacterium]|nr:DUF5985 family protein [Candidatus Binatia bacterium]